MNTSEILIYQNNDGNIKIDVRLEEETVWLTQAQMGFLFNKDKRTISEHILNIFKEGELDEKVVVRKFRTTIQHGAIAGKTQQIEVNTYNLDVIISVGYRVKSQQGTQFRIWATQRLKEYIVKGISLINPVPYSRYLNTKYQYITTLLTIICENIFANSKKCHTFIPIIPATLPIRTAHPGRFSLFYRLLVSNSLNTKVYALQ
jgi:hypothetical protein